MESHPLTPTPKGPVLASARGGPFRIPGQPLCAPAAAVTLVSGNLDRRVGIMGWDLGDGKHAGWAACVVPDGRLSVGSTGVGQLVHGVTGKYPQDNLSPEVEIVPDIEVQGWRAACECGWRGMMWSRVRSEDHADFAAGKVFVPEGGFADAPQALEDAIGDEWRAHCAPPKAVAAIEEAAAAYTDAARALARAVAAARALEVPWSDVGRAAGVSRQAAHERWSAGPG
jgi:hypothetical protein